MTEQSQYTYEKQDSFVGLRRDPADREAILDRVRRVANGLDSCDLPKPRKEILRQACGELLAGPGRARQFALTDHAIAEIERLEDASLLRYLYYRYRYEVFPQTLQLDDYPPSLEIEPTSVCNYRCVFCFQTDSGFTKKANGYMASMSLDLFKRVVDEAEGNCDAVTLVGRGEPLAAPDIVPMLEYCRGKFLALKLNTNASLLTERKIHALLQAGIATLVFSADAATEPLYSQLRVRGHLDKVLKNIRQFREIQQRHYPESKTVTRVSGVYLGHDQSLDNMERLWGDLVDQVAFVKYNPWENTYDQPVNNLHAPCSELWRRMFVWADGTVNPCQNDYKSALAVGNISSSSITGLWRSERYERLREHHLARQRSQEYPCNRCSVV